MMNAVMDAARASLANAAPKKGDYPVNGILYCGCCNKPKEAFKTFLGQTMKVGIMCDCQEAEYHRQEAERRAQKISVNRMRAFGTDKMAKKLSQKNFANSDPTKCDPNAMEIVREYADNYDTYRQEGAGILLCGAVGTGKTYAALCILNKLLDDCHTGLFTSFSRIANDLFGLKSERGEYIYTLTNYDAVVIDDLGVERNSEWMNEQVYSVVDAFIRAEKPMIVTTNLQKEEIENATDISKQRIYSRIMGCCKPVRFAGRDLRRSNWEGSNVE